MADLSSLPRMIWPCWVDSEIGETLSVGLGPLQVVRVEERDTRAGFSFSRNDPKKLQGDPKAIIESPIVAG